MTLSWQTNTNSNRSRTTHLQVFTECEESTSLSRWCVCVCVCYSTICSTAAFWLKMSVFSAIHHVFSDFDSFKSYGKFFAVLALSAVRLRFQSDLLDGTAFEALPLVVCTKGPMYKKSVDTSLHPSASWG